MSGDKIRDALDDLAKRFLWRDNMLLDRIATLTDNLAAERALADELAVELASVMSAADYEHREPGDPLTRWEVRRGQ